MKILKTKVCFYDVGTFEEILPWKKKQEKSKEN